jgi:NADH:ubiquinone oxidoreductase subunit 6 (subunit J)
VGAEATSWFLFTVLAVVIVGCSLAMMLSRNFVHSAVFLAGALLSFAGLYAMLDATFLALLQLFIYAGAVTVVVVFVVMLTSTSVVTYDSLLQRQTWLALIVGVAFALPLIDSLTTLAKGLPAAAAAPGGTEELARALLTTHVAPFEISSAILLAALVGAIYLAREAS